jgi:uncharacterized protein
MLVYVLSDLHLSSNDTIPSWIIEKIKNADLILINGDITSEKILKEICSYSKCFAVQGNCDSLNLPKTNVFEINNIKCGQTHGDEVSPRGDWEQLYSIAVNLDVNILFNGHTHNFSVYEYKNKLFINPGSATGTTGLICDREMETIGEIIFSDKDIHVKIISKNEILIDLRFDGDLFK